MLVDLVITITESVAIILEGRRRHGRIAITRVPIYIRRQASTHVLAGSCDARVEALPRNF